MREGPGPAPELALEGVGVLQRDAAAIGAADVADDDARLDRGVADEAGDLGLCRGARVVEGAAALVLVEGDAPAIGMGPGLPAAAHQPGEAEDDVGRDIGAHAEKFAHGGRVEPGWAGWKPGGTIAWPACAFPPRLR